ncbi:hypothetical protein D3C72_1900250 [compost metagenome]
MNTAQATERLEVHRGIAHGQVTALYQRIPQLTRQIQMFEIAFVEPPRCQQDHQGWLCIVGCQADQGLLQSPEKTRQMLHLQIPVQLRQGP